MPRVWQPMESGQGLFSAGRERMANSFLTRKTIEDLRGWGDGDAHGPGFTRSLGVVSLTALGIGAIIGAGIFVLTGAAAARYAGPAIILSFGWPDSPAPSSACAMPNSRR